jgi:pilus assembly protein CpaC
MIRFILPAVLVGFLSLAGTAQAQSRVQIMVSESGKTSVSKDLLLPLNKSSVVELNVPAADVIITNPAIADAVVRSSQRVIFRGVSTGETNAFFFDINGNQLLDLQIRVEQDLTGLEDLYRRLLPDARINVEASNGAIILTGRVANLSEASTAVELANNFVQSSGGSSAGETGGLQSAGGSGDDASSGKVINMLTVEGKDQVLLKVRIVEMQRTLTKQLGVNVTNTQNYGDYVPAVRAPVYLENPSLENPFGIPQLDANGNQIYENIAPGYYTGNSTNSTSNAFNVAGRSLGGLALSTALSNFVGPTGSEVLQSSIGANLQALERIGLVRTLAEPNLTAISGESAKFLAGGEYPVPVGQDDTGSVKLEFKPFGVGLAFTPVVLSEGRISLRISTEVSELTQEGAFAPESVAGTDASGNVVTYQSINIPALSVRRAETTVELPSGGSTVIAGLIQEKTKQSLDSVPGIKNVPILGALFRSRDFQNDETELVVIVTPYLVDPADPNKLRTPDEGYSNAGDLATIFLGRLNDIYAVPGSNTDGKTFDAPVGFIVE